MQRVRSVPKVLSLLLVAGLALTLPFAASADPKAGGSAWSVTARAAQADGEAGDRLFPIGSPAIETAKATAVAYWGGQPCGGAYELVWTPLDAGTNATASWRNPSDAWANPAENFDCRIDLNPAADYDYEKLCTVVTHEIGHLLGRQHDPAAGNLMSAYYTTPIAPCEVPEPAGQATAADTAADIDITASEPRRSLRKKSVKKVKRCVVRKRNGKRVKRCTMVPARKAKATKAAKRRSA